MPSEGSSICATDGSASSSRSRICPRFNPYKRFGQRSSFSYSRSSPMTTIPIDFLTYCHTSHPIIPSLDTFNNDIDNTLPRQSIRKRKRISHPHIVSNRNLARTPSYNVEAAQASYPLACFEDNVDCWSDAVMPAFRFTRNEGSLDVRIERMTTAIKGFEKAFWQT
ncbi:hypothetical protein V8E51_010753 [Hyaloscypha variabilis]